MSQSRKSAILVIYNPAAGAGQAREFFERDLLPVLRKHGREPRRIAATESPGHAGEVVLGFLKTVTEPHVDVVLGSGDGTLHEILDAIERNRAELGDRVTELTFALVPCGTANALYHALFPSSPEQKQDIPNDNLLSLHSMLAPEARARPLILARTTILPPTSINVAASSVARTSVSAVVASTALHASILHDSEALRASHPGIERFKLAAAQNITRWYRARVRLVVAPPAVPGTSLTPGVEVYDPRTGQFVLCAGDEASHDASVVELAGPFAYFLSTTNADRLEPAFRIAPKQSTFPPPPLSSPATMDVVVLRPRRDPSIVDDSEESRQAFAQKCMTVLGGAYRDGAHIDMRYGPAGEILDGPGEGLPVVEYYRCNGWEWIPEEGDEAARFVCADGEILTIEPGGKATCLALQTLDGINISAYA